MFGKSGARRIVATNVAKLAHAKEILYQTTGLSLHPSELTPTLQSTVLRKNTSSVVAQSKTYLRFLSFQKTVFLVLFLLPLRVDTVPVE